MKMYSIILFCMVAAVVKTEVSQEIRDKFVAAQQDCMQASGVSNEMLAKAMEGEFPESPEFKQHLVCVGKKGGIIDAEGKYHLDLLKKKLLIYLDDEALVDSILEQCYIPKGTLEDTAFDMAKCACAKYKESL